MAEHHKIELCFHHMVVPLPGAMTSPDIALHRLVSLRLDTRHLCAVNVGLLLSREEFEVALARKCRHNKSRPIHYTKSIAFIA